MGNVAFIPLGGDGYGAPIAAYSISGPQVVGDGSGGNARLDIVMDARYSSLISYSTLVVRQGTAADIDVQRTIGGASSGRAIPLLIENLKAVANSATVSIDTIAENWFPPPVLLPGATDIARLRYRIQNVLNDTAIIYSLIYLFQLNVRQVNPMGPILWARGSS